jgi:hypothetical protein
MADLAIVETQVLQGDNATTRRGTAGATLRAGDAVYYDETLRRWLPSEAASTPEASEVDGIALNAAGFKQTVTVQTDGAITLGAGAAPVVGTLYGVSATPGRLAPLMDVKDTWHRTVVGCGDVNNVLLLGIVNSRILPGSPMNDELMRTVIAPVQVSDNTAQVGTILDIAGYSEVTFNIIIGTIADADATFTVLLEEGDAADLSDAAPVADADMVSQTTAVAPEVAASWNFGDDSEVRKLGYVGAKRYLRLTVTPALNAGLADFLVYAVLGAGPSSPITQTPS